MSSGRMMTPASVLAEHPITRHLRSLGLTDAQLASVRFRKHEGDRFEMWRVMAAGDWPVHLLHDMRVWCALRWLILDEPPASPDTRDAWEEVARYMAQPIYQAGWKQIQNGADRGSTSREAADRRAKAFAADVESLRARNERLTKTGAVKSVARDQGVTPSVAWGYMKRAAASVPEGPSSATDSVGIKKHSG